MREINEGDITVLGNLLSDIACLAKDAYVGWLVEYMCCLFDDDRIDDFARGLAGYYGLSEIAVARLRAFRTAIDEYWKSVPSGTSDEDVVASPRWGEIRELAKAFVHASEPWEREHPRDALGYTRYVEPSPGCE